LVQQKEAVFRSLLAGERESHTESTEILITRHDAYEKHFRKIGSNLQLLRQQLSELIKYSGIYNRTFYNSYPFITVTLVHLNHSCYMECLKLRIKLQLDTKVKPNPKQACQYSGNCLSGYSCQARQQHPIPARITNLWGQYYTIQFTVKVKLSTQVRLRCLYF
jgi:hypothetical protein